MSGLRWSEDQLRAHLAKQGVKSAPIRSKNSAKIKLADVRHEVDGKEVGDAQGKVLLSKHVSRKKSVIDSILQARLSGSHVKGQWIELRFDGAQVLKRNDLDSLTHWQRIKYRKTWHDAAYWALLHVTGGPKNFECFSQFRLSATMSNKRLVDYDGLGSIFKYVIDGLRYAGIILNDDPAHMQKFEADQVAGDPAVIIRIESLSIEHQISQSFDPCQTKI